jgi:hypothetical protein
MKMTVTRNELAMEFSPFLHQHSGSQEWFMKAMSIEWYKNDGADIVLSL